MKKQIGIFEIEVSTGGYPIWCIIKDDRGNTIRFHHQDISDLQHAICEIKKTAANNLPDQFKNEV